MRSYLALLVWTLSLAPAGAQFEDLIRQGRKEASLPDRPVTLALRTVTTEEAVAKLAEAAGVPLSCAPALAERRVSLTCRQRPAREVAQGLACAVGGRWRQEGEVPVLEPADPVELLTPDELAGEMASATHPPDMPSDSGMRQVEQELPGLFTPGQLDAASTEEGAPFRELRPALQRRLVWLQAREATRALHLASSRLRDVERPEGLVAEISLGGGGLASDPMAQWLLVRGPGSTALAPLRDAKAR